MDLMKKVKGRCSAGLSTADLRRFFNHFPIVSWGRNQALSVYICEVITVNPKYAYIPCLLQICLLVKCLIYQPKKIMTYQKFAEISMGCSLIVSNFRRFFPYENWEHYNLRRIKHEFYSVSIILGKYLFCNF